MNKCEKCGRVFDCKGSLKKHMNRKIPCIVLDQSKSTRFKCESCNRCFTTNQSLKYHIENTCQIIKNKKNEEDTNIRVRAKIAELNKKLSEEQDSKSSLLEKLKENHNAENVILHKKIVTLEATIENITTKHHSEIIELTNKLKVTEHELEIAKNTENKLIETHRVEINNFNTRVSNSEILKTLF